MLRKGVEKAVAEKPDLIVMDIMMPEISGVGGDSNLARQSQNQRYTGPRGNSVVPAHPTSRDVLLLDVTITS
jgi:CheY-like chemotaxis protein